MVNSFDNNYKTLRYIIKLVGSYTLKKIFVLFPNCTCIRPNTFN